MGSCQCNGVDVVTEEGKVHYDVEELNRTYS